VEPGAAGAGAVAEVEPAGPVNDNGALIPRDAGARRRRFSALDRRVMLLTRELGLTANQQGQVRKALESQREQVARVWSDTSVAPARRVGATQAIADRTAERIRALLTEEQRKKYLQPRKREAAVGASGARAEAWMTAGRRR